MSTFVNGPIAGRSLSVRRAPYLLRVVVDRETGDVDALDQLSDEPRDGEDVHVYRLMAPPQTAHVCGRGRGASGWFEFGLYEYVPDAPAADLRDTARWREWASARHASDVAA